MSSSSQSTRRDKKRNWFVNGVTAASIASIGLLAFFIKKQFMDKTKESNQSNLQTITKLDRLSQPLPKNYYGTKIQLSDYYENLLKELSAPKLVFKHFMTCLSTPRPSGKLDKMRAALKTTADLLGVEYTQDSVGNVCIKKPGSKGYENATGVVIQCHMDMVCTKTDDSKFDFDNDGINAYVDGDWLKAKNTTLGADDGIGVAAGLALFEHPGLIHGPIELLITVDEETSMGGAIGLAKAPFLKNKVLINVDSEEINRICIGCAGGFSKEFIVNMNRKQMYVNDQYKMYNLNICGLFGGHTGIEIHLGRANAIKLLCRILNYLINDQNIKIQLIEMCGGNAANAIPSNSYCQLLIASESSNLFEKSVNFYWKNFILEEYETIEPKMKLAINSMQTETENELKICDHESSNLLVSLMMNLPNGVIRASPSVDGLVQTSIAFSLLNLNKDSNRAICGLLARSMSMNEMKELNRKLDSLKTLIIGNNNNKIEISDVLDLYPGWLPVTSSPSLKHCKDAHVALFNEIPEVYAVHAGLECGMIKDKYPSMDCLSIGPLIKHAHSTDEKLDIKTVDIFYQWLVETITRIAVKT